MLVIKSTVGGHSIMISLSDYRNQSGPLTTTTARKRYTVHCKIRCAVSDGNFVDELDMITDLREIGTISVGSIEGGPIDNTVTALSCHVDD